VERKHRVLIVSGRLLVAQGLVSLLTNVPEVEDVLVTEDLYEALVYSEHNLPDVILIDLPAGAGYFIDGPVRMHNHEIRTIVLQEGERNGQTTLYIYNPGIPANLHNLLAAILSSEEMRPFENALEIGDLAGLTTLNQPADAPAPGFEVLEPQPTSFINARASGPSRSRISPSRDEL
jgi:hypothetical protein